MDRASPTARATNRVRILRSTSTEGIVEDLLSVLQTTNRFSIVPDDISWLDSPPSPETLDDVALALLAVGCDETEQVDAALAAYRRSGSPTPLIVVAGADADPDHLLGWLDQGVSDFITPPFSSASVLPRLCKHAVMVSEEDLVVSRLKAKLGLAQIVGENADFMAQIQRIPMIADCSASVLIQGETGTGKELIARSIHHLSDRSAQPFIAVSCAGIPEGLAENELWGHAKGAYTGASHRQRGLIAEAHRGTLLLDDVDCLTPAIQAKLLRFLQEREYRALGSPRIHKADVRVIASSNLDLAKAASEGRFRLDLYHRLNVVPIDLPPLRDRVEDIPLLAFHFVQRHADELGIEPPRIPAHVIDLLLMYDWPGNVRELEHVIERALILGRGAILDPSTLMLPSSSSDTSHASFREAKADVIRRFERTYLERQLSTHRGNVARAARASGKHRRAFFELIRKHHIDVSRFREECPTERRPSGP